MASDSRFRPDDLLKHGRFVKSLARELARDEDEADDLAARTFAAALASRPDSGPSLRVWLRRVLGRLFLRTRRDDERRVRRDFASAASVAIEAPATIDVVARMELERAIAAAFAALDEPYRATLFLRYFDDLPPREIAARMDVPVETVRTRTKRGLARLRATLDAQQSGKPLPWRGVALALSGSGTKVAIVTKTQLGVAAAAAALLLAYGMVRVPAPARIGDLAFGASPAAVALARANDPNAGSAVVIAPAIAASSPTPHATRQEELPFATGVVVDEQGAPLADVAVVASRKFLQFRRDGVDQFGRTPLDPAMLERERLTTTGSDGGFVLAAAPADLAALYFVKAERCASVWPDLAEDRAANQARRIVLQRGCSVTGRVLDTAGSPIATAAVQASIPGSALADWVEVRGVVDGDGRFRLDWQPSKPASFLVTAPGYEYGGPGHDRPGLRSVLDRARRDAIDVVLTRACTIVDVRDAATLAPLAGVRGLLGRADERGRCRDDVTQESSPGRLLIWEQSDFWATFGELDEPRCCVEIALFAPDHRTRTLDYEAARRGEPLHLTVDLEAGREEAAISGRIVGAERANVQLFFGHGSRWPRKPDESTLRTVAVGVDGAFAFAGLPRADYRLEIESPGMAPRGLDLTAPVNDLLVELVASPALEVAVVDDVGVAQPGARVWVQSADDAHAWTAIADERGVARLDGLTNGGLRVEAFPSLKEGEAVGSVRPLAPQELDDFGSVTLAPGERWRIERTVRSHVAVTLRAQLADGTRVGGLQLTWRNAVSSASRLFGKDDDRLRSLVLTTDEAGEVRFQAFPGHHEFEARRGPQRFWCEARLRRDGPSRVTIVVPAYSGRGSIRGQLFELGSDVVITGRPVRAIELRADGSEGASLSTYSDGAGAFVFTDVPAGRIRLVACSSAPEAGDAAASRPYRETARTLELPSDKEQTIELEAARDGAPPAGTATIDLDLEVVDDATEEPLAGVAIAILGIDADSEFDLATPTSDQAGRVRLRLPASEHYRLLVRDQRLDVLPCDGIASATIRLRRAE